MVRFIPIREILCTDAPKLIQLKKKYNKCASMLNFYCEGRYLSARKKASLLEELFISGKAMRWSKKSGQKSCLTLRNYAPEKPIEKAS